MVTTPSDWVLGKGEGSLAAIRAAKWQSEGPTQGMGGQN